MWLAAFIPPLPRARRTFPKALFISWKPVQNIILHAVFMTSFI